MFQSLLNLNNLDHTIMFICALIMLIVESLDLQTKFDQFVEQGKVLHNYASILELLLRLRQCCDHPFLVMRYLNQPPCEHSQM